MSGSERIENSEQAKTEGNSFFKVRSAVAIEPGELLPRCSHACFILSIPLLHLSNMLDQRALMGVSGWPLLHGAKEIQARSGPPRPRQFHGRGEGEEQCPHGHDPCQHGGRAHEEEGLSRSS